MSLDWQLVIVAAAGVLAAGFLGLSAWRTWSGGKAGCGSGCAKCAAPPAPATDDPPGRISLPQI